MIYLHPWLWHILACACDISYCMPVIYLCVHPWYILAYDTFLLEPVMYLCVCLWHVFESACEMFFLSLAKEKRHSLNVGGTSCGRRYKTEQTGRTGGSLLRSALTSLIPDCRCNVGGHIMPLPPLLELHLMANLLHPDGLHPLLNHKLLSSILP